ncbi:MAG TPA: site-specific DNA-methyltransferase [Abditibacteriaceae bacterium]
MFSGSKNSVVPGIGEPATDSAGAPTSGFCASGASAPALIAPATHLVETGGLGAYVPELGELVQPVTIAPAAPTFQPPLGKVFHADCIKKMARLPAESTRLVVADPPYFQVLRGQAWDCQWRNQEEYLEWTAQWLDAAMRLLVPGGLLYCFGQLGKREHVMLHLMSQCARSCQFHDLIIWDRAVGYNERRDSFTPCYEMILVLRKDGPICFDKNAVREPYDERTRKQYARDKRYADRAAREAHLNSGKYATNLWRVPSLKGASREKVGHPSQKPEAVIERIIRSSSAPGELVIDPFLGSGTTAVVAERLGRRWIGIERLPEYVQLSRKRVRKVRLALREQG